MQTRRSNYPTTGQRVTKHALAIISLTNLTQGGANESPTKNAADGSTDPRAGTLCAKCRRGNRSRGVRSQSPHEYSETAPLRLCLIRPQPGICLEQSAEP